MDYGRRYHMQLFKIKETILFIEMSLLFKLLVDWENIILMSNSYLFPSSDTDEFENIRTHNLNTISIAIALSNAAS